MKHINLFETFSELTYQRISYDIYAQSRNSLKSIPFDNSDINRIKNVTKGTLDSFKKKSGHKTRHVVRIEGKVPFLGWGKTPCPLFVTIDKYDDDWFFVHITTDNRLDPSGIGALDQSFWKCDQIQGVLDLIKNEIKVEI